MTELDNDCIDMQDIVEKENFYSDKTEREWEGGARVCVCVETIQLTAYVVW